MNISIYQIILGLIAFVFIVNGSFKFFKRAQGQTFFKFAVTIVIWASIFAFAIFPNISHMISEKIGLGENLNTLIFIGFVVIFLILFKMLSIIERAERNISEIVRKEALSKLEKK
ncbi:MAG: DUF2304 domain-containing protein [Parcubacteria group bacterium]